eukprot:315490-Chlamydomonas_euryale.AAC.1
MQFTMNMCMGPKKVERHATAACRTLLAVQGRRFHSAAHNQDVHGIGNRTLIAAAAAAARSASAGFNATLVIGPKMSSKGSADWAAGFADAELPGT